MNDDKLKDAMYEIAQINGFSEDEYHRLLKGVDHWIDEFARRTEYMKTGETPDLEYKK